MQKIRYILWFLIAFCLSVGARAQVNIIFDTDMGSDCDDAGALAVLHQLTAKGEARILGVIYSSGRNRYGVGVCDAIDHYYGRGDILIGQYRGNDIGDPGDPYSSAIARNMVRFPHRLVDSAMELVLAYRTILASQPDTSVTIVTTGHPNGLAKLLADSTGRQLVRRKVKRWVAMAYTDTIPKVDWNFGKNGAATCITGLLKDWPTPIFLSGQGKMVLTGNKQLPLTGVHNPVREVYHLWKNSLATGRSSWDPIAVLFAVRPQYFTVKLGALKQNTHDETWWEAGENGKRQYRVMPLLSNSELEVMIEGLMAAPPVR